MANDGGPKHGTELVSLDGGALAASNSVAKFGSNGFSHWQSNDNRSNGGSVHAPHDQCAKHPESIEFSTTIHDASNDQCSTDESPEYLSVPHECSECVAATDELTEHKFSTEHGVPNELAEH